MEGSFDSENKGTFTWSDAWVLASVAVGGGLKGCELNDVIAAGDLINRAIFNADELRSGLVKLMALLALLVALLPWGRMTRPRASSRLRR